MSLLFDTHTNFAYSTVSVAPSPASSGLSLTVVDASLFPGTVPFNIVVWPVGVQPTGANAEIMTVTNSGAAFTVTRTQEGTAARAVVVGDQVAVAITAKTLQDVESLQPSIARITTTGTVTALTLPTSPVGGASPRGPLVLIVNNASTLTIQGIAAGLDGQRLTIYPIGAGGVSLSHQNVGASAANRIITLSGTDNALFASSQSSASLIYDLTTARWRMDIGVNHTFFNLTATGTTILDITKYKRNVLASAGNTTLTTAMSGSCMLLDGVVAYSLPAIAAADIGVFYDFFTTVAPAPASITAQAGDLLVGSINMMNSAPTALTFVPNGTTHLVCTLNGSTSGGIVGSYLRFTAISATRWFIEGTLLAAGGASITPFS